MRLEDAQEFSGDGVALLLDKPRAHGGWWWKRGEDSPRRAFFGRMSYNSSKEIWKPQSLSYLPANEKKASRMRRKIERMREMLHWVPHKELSPLELLAKQADC